MFKHFHAVNCLTKKIQRFLREKIILGLSAGGTSLFLKSPTVHCTLYSSSKHQVRKIRFFVVKLPNFMDCNTVDEISVDFQNYKKTYSVKNCFCSRVGRQQLINNFVVDFFHVFAATGIFWIGILYLNFQKWGNIYFQLDIQYKNACFTEKKLKQIIIKKKKWQNNIFCK